jgi:hypothetical protein
MCMRQKIERHKTEDRNRICRRLAPKPKRWRVLVLKACGMLRGLRWRCKLVTICDWFSWKYSAVVKLGEIRVNLLNGTVK